MAKPITVEKVIEYIERFNLCGDFAGQKCVLRPWQKQILERLFAIDPESGRRIVRKALLLFPRKHAKTWLCGAICLVALLTYGNNQVIVSLASSEKQAGELFRAITEILDQDASLKKLFDIIPSKQFIRCKFNKSTFQALACGGKSTHGKNPSMVIVDEFHSFTTKKHFDSYVALVTGRGGRTDPQTIIISTMTSDMQSLMGQEYSYACTLKNRIVNGEVIAEGEKDNPSYLAVIYGCQYGDDWHDKALWKKCSPALGDWIPWTEYEDNYRMACDIESFQTEFKTLYLNYPADPDCRWLGLDRVKKAYGSIPPEQYLGSKTWCGLDVAPVNDLSCLALLHVLPDGRLYLRLKTWCNAESIKEQARLNKVPYDIWRDKGYIVETPGNATDFDMLADGVIEDLKQYKVKSIAADKAYCFDIAQKLQNNRLPIYWFKQWFIPFGPSVAKFEWLLLNNKLVIEDNPVLEHCIHNVRMDYDTAGNKKPSNSKRQDHEKIDGAVAAIMAVGKWAEDNIEKKKSSWEDGIRDMFI